MKCKVDDYKDLITKQPKIRGECWVYKDKYTAAKKHQQINNHKRKAEETDTVNNEFDQLDPSDTEERNYHNKYLFSRKIRYISILMILYSIAVFKLIFRPTI